MQSEKTSINLVQIESQVQILYAFSSAAAPFSPSTTSPFSASSTTASFGGGLILMFLMRNARPIEIAPAALDQLPFARTRGRRTHRQGLRG